MGEDEAPPPPAPVMPAAPTPSEATEASLAAQLKYAPQYLAMNQAQLPQYAQLQTDIQRAQVPQMSQINLENQQIYGPQLIQTALDNLKLADPTGFAIREQYGQSVLGELGQGGALTPQEQRDLEQDVRASQVSRGVGTGFSDAVQESVYKNQGRFARQQQRLANAGAFLAGTPPQGSFGALNQGGQTAPTVGQPGAMNFANMLPSTNALIGLQAQNYGNALDFAGRNYSTQMQGYGMDISQPNPFMTGLGIATGAGVALGGAAISRYCWVAEELWGKASPRVPMVRVYVHLHKDDNDKLGKFCREYIEHGREWAILIRYRQDMRFDAGKLWMALYEAAIDDGMDPPESMIEDWLKRIKPMEA